MGVDRPPPGRPARGPAARNPQNSVTLSPDMIYHANISPPKQLKENRRYLSVKKVYNVMQKWCNLTPALVRPGIPD